MNTETLEKPGTNITPELEAAFKALIGGEYDNFALFSCFVNGEPAAAISAVTKDGDDFIVTPIFVSLTPSMSLTDHDNRKLSPYE